MRNQILLSELRVKYLNSLAPKDKKYVLYWMQSSQRSEYNFALTYAISEANRLNRPLLAFFGLTPNFPEANLRHYHFMLRGLQEAAESLEAMGVKTIVLVRSPEKAIADLAGDSCLIVVDKCYLRTLRHWYASVAQSIRCPLVQVEDNVIVPLDEASRKEEYSAATLRLKITAKRNQFLFHPPKIVPQRDSLSQEFESLDLKNITKIISDLPIDKSVAESTHFEGGTSPAIKLLDEFITNKLEKFPEQRNDPTANCTSGMSPYLHFGQISPIYIAKRILEAKASSQAKEAYLEELAVRRELAANYVYYNEKYDSFDGLPNWAKQTLKQHQNDQRDYLYNLEELEKAKTHDSYWNAAQNEMRVTGKMHGYMRMYWGKKLIEWSRTPETAFQRATYLNNKYEIDGRSPNGFAGVAWCFGKHDRPWKERSVFGKVRYMTANGLKRKFDADKYLLKIKNLGSSS